MNSSTTLVRGIPMLTDEVIAMELQFGGQLFDESTFDTTAKKVACANVIHELDRYLRVWQEKNHTTELPDYLPDFPDRSWLYIPVALFPPDSGMVALRTIRNPAGLIAWFRVKKHFRFN